jgi:hypothetical protein
LKPSGYPLANRFPLRLKTLYDGGGALGALRHSGARVSANPESRNLQNFWIPE